MAWVINIINTALISRALLQIYSAVKNTPYLASIQIALMILGVLKTTKAQPTSLATATAPFLSRREVDFAVSIESKKRIAATPNTEQPRMIIKLLENPKSALQPQRAYGESIRSLGSGDR